MATKTFIPAANEYLAKAEAIALIREMDITCAPLGGDRYRLDYRHNDPRRVLGDEGTAYFASSIREAYDVALFMCDRPLFIEAGVHIVMHREALAAHLAR